MNSLKNNNLFKVFVALCALSIGSLFAMEQKEPFQLTLTEPEWAIESKKQGVSSPLRVRLSNYTGSQLHAVIQGQGNEFVADLPNKNTYDYERFNMNAHRTDIPQYTIRTNKNVYTLNFEKKSEKPALFKALLKRVRFEQSATNSLRDNDVLTWIPRVEKELAQELDNVSTGKTLIINLQPDTANLSIINE